MNDSCSKWFHYDSDEWICVKIGNSFEWKTEKFQVDLSSGTPVGARETCSARPERTSKKVAFVWFYRTKMTHASHKVPFVPTCIDHCVRANFINENETNLIVARSTLLQIYTMRTNNVSYLMYFLKFLTKTLIYRIPKRNLKKLLWI